MKYDFLIVGSGFFAATFARLATDAGKRCLVVEKSPFIGGAAHDSVIVGLLVSQFGAHIFHTSSEDIWQFVNRFGQWESFINKPKAVVGDRIFSFPINLMTMHQLWGLKTPQEAIDKLRSQCIPCQNPRNFEEWALSKIGRDLYQTFVYGYTKKQYHCEPSELPASILQRLPIRLTFEENYFTTKYQAIPVGGYTKIVEAMLEGTKVVTDHAFVPDDRWRQIANHLVYSGPIDAFFKHVYGYLDYHTLRFEFQKVHGDFQGNAVMNYPDAAVKHLRSVEYKHFLNPRRFLKHHDEDESPSVIGYDIPVKFHDHPEPYYPLRDEKNSALYAKYAALAKSLPDVTFGGRLGSYSYLDLDQAIGQAMAKAKILLE